MHVVGPFGGAVPASLPALATANAGQLYTNAAPELDYMFLNVRTPPFDDPRVRRALNYAVDRREIARLAGGPDLAQPTCQLLPPGFPNYRPSCPYTVHPSPGGGWSGPDIERARRLIEQSGTKGTKVTVWINREKRAIGPLLRLAAARTRLPQLAARLPRLRDVPHRDGADSRTPRADRHRRLDRRRRGSVELHTTVPLRGDRPALARQRQPGPSSATAASSRGSRRRWRARGPRADALWRDVYRDLETAAPAVPLVNRRTVTLLSKRVGNYQHHPVWTTLLEQLWVR